MRLRDDPPTFILLPTSVPVPFGAEEPVAEAEGLRLYPYPDLEEHERVIAFDRYETNAGTTTVARVVLERNVVWTVEPATMRWGRERRREARRGTRGRRGARPVPRCERLSRRGDVYAGVGVREALVLHLVTPHTLPFQLDRDY